MLGDGVIQCLGSGRHLFERAFLILTTVVMQVTDTSVRYEAC